MRYLVNVIADGTENDDPAVMDAIDAFNDTLRAGGHWVFADGLADPGASTVLDARGDRADRPVITDGPFVEAKEWAAGFWIIEADDLDAALALMAGGSRACDRRLEIRPILQPPA